MINKNTLDFLRKLSENNNRVWFHENKNEFDKIKKDFESFVTSLIARISHFDPDIAHLEAKKCIFRINRDTRFSKNKSPYKINLWAHINAVSKLSQIHGSAGYYVHLEPGNSMLAWWAYMPDTKWLHDIRQKIANNPKKFTDIIENKDFKKYFAFVWLEKLKRPPVWFPKDHEAIEMLKNKSFLADCMISDKDVLSEGFLDFASGAFKELKKFNDFLNEA